MIQDTIETCLKNFLQQNIKIQVKEKVLKQGRLILFNVKDFYIIFTFRMPSNDLKKYEMPLPFTSSVKNGEGVLDYRLDKIAKKDTPLYYTIKCLNTTKKSKFYDSVIYIKPV